MNCKNEAHRPVRTVTGGVPSVRGVFGRGLAVLGMALLFVTVSACGAEGGDGAAVPGADGALDGAAEVAPGEGGGAVDETAAVGADASVTDSELLGAISSGTAERPIDPQPEATAVPLVESKLVRREELLELATVPMFEPTDLGPDDQVSYRWVTARNGDGAPWLPQALLTVTLNFTRSYFLTQWEIKDGALMPEEGDVVDVTVAGAPAKFWTLRAQSVLTWDNGNTRLRMKSLNMTQDDMIEFAGKLVPIE